MSSYRPTYERRTPYSLLRLTEALTGASEKQLRESLVASPRVGTTAAARRNQLAGPPTARSPPPGLRTMPNKPPSSPSRRLAFEDPHDSVPAIATPTQQSSSETSPTRPSTGGSAAYVHSSPSPIRATGPYDERSPATGFKAAAPSPATRRDASTVIIADSCVRLNQLVDLASTEALERRRLHDEEDATYFSRITRRFRDGADAIAASVAVEEARRRAATEATPKRTAPHPFPYPSSGDDRSVTPGLNTSSDSGVSLLPVMTDASPRKFEDAEFVQRWDTELQEQQFRRRVFVRERLDRDAIVTFAAAEVNLSAAMESESVIRASIDFAERADRGELQRAEVGRHEDVKRMQLWRYENGMFVETIDKPLSNLWMREGLAAAHREGRAAIQRERDDTIFNAARQLFEPLFVGLTRDEARQRSSISAAQQHETYFAVSYIAVDECERLTRKQDLVDRQDSEWASTVQLECDLRARVKVAVSEREQRQATVLGPLGGERNDIVNALFARSKEHLVAQELVARDALHDTEAKEGAVTRRVGRMLNCQGVMTRLLGRNGRALLSSRFRTWTRFVQHKRRARSILQYRIRKLAAMNSSILGKRYLRRWQLTAHRNATALHLLGSSCTSLLRGRFLKWVARRQTWLYAPAAAVVAAREADARNAVAASAAESWGDLMADTTLTSQAARLAQEETTQRRRLSAMRRFELASCAADQEVHSRIAIETNQTCAAAPLLMRAGRLIHFLPAVYAIVESNEQLLRNRYFQRLAGLVAFRKRVRGINSARATKLAARNNRVVIRRYFVRLRKFATLKRRVASLLGRSIQRLAAIRFATWRRLASTKVHERAVAAQRATLQKACDDEAKARDAIRGDEAAARHFAASVESQHAMMPPQTAARLAITVEEANLRKALNREARRLRSLTAYASRNEAKLASMCVAADRELQMSAFRQWRAFFASRTQMYRQHFKANTNLALAALLMAGTD